jgi:hypothetical protein
MTSVPVKKCPPMHLPLWLLPIEYRLNEELQQSREKYPRLSPMLRMLLVVVVVVLREE